jgi:hypothetical protein
MLILGVRIRPGLLTISMIHMYRRIGISGPRSGSLATPRFFRLMSVPKIHITSSLPSLKAISEL